MFEVEADYHLTVLNWVLWILYDLPVVLLVGNIWSKQSKEAELDHSIVPGS